MCLNWLILKFLSKTIIFLNISVSGKYRSTSDDVSDQKVTCARSCGHLEAFGEPRSPKTS